MSKKTVEIVKVRRLPRDEAGNLMPLQQLNPHKAPKAMWRKWPDISQRLFNDVYESMLDNQRLFNHPQAPVIPYAQWKTVAWNSAWTAADGVLAALKAIERAEGYAKA